MRQHLADHVEDGPDELIFTGAKGAPLRSGNFARAVKWTKTVASLGLAGFHFHDLRHTGNTLAAASEASTRELMHRMGHATMRAALINSTPPASVTAKSPRRWTAASPEMAAASCEWHANGTQDPTWGRGGEAQVPRSCGLPGPSSVERATGIEPA